LRGNLNLECNVLSRGKLNVATPEVAVGRAIYLLDHTATSKAQYMYVFCVPPGPLMKNASWLENIL